MLHKCNIIWDSVRYTYWNFQRSINTIFQFLKFTLLISSQRYIFFLLFVIIYFTSNSFHRIWSASLIQRLFGFMLSPIGWLKSRNKCRNLSIGLYIDLTPLYLKSPGTRSRNGLLPFLQNTFQYSQSFEALHPLVQPEKTPIPEQSQNSTLHNNQYSSSHE